MFCSKKSSIWLIIGIVLGTIVAVLTFSQPVTATTDPNPSSPTTNTQYWSLAYADGTGGNMVHIWWFRRTFTATYGANLVTVIPKGITVWGCDGSADCTVYNSFFENTTPGTEGLAIHGQALVTGTFIINTIIEEPYEEPFTISSTLTVRQLTPSVAFCPNIKAGDFLDIKGSSFTSPFVSDLRSLTISIRNTVDNSFETYDLIEVIEMGGSWEENRIRLPVRQNIRTGVYLVTINVGSLSENCTFTVLTSVFLPSVSFE